jgi:hypothetical protein
MPKTICPVCRNADDGYCATIPTTGDRVGFDCERCGRYEISDTALADEYIRANSKISKVTRAALSHALRTRFRKGELITSTWLAENLAKLKLPSPAQQVANLVRIIGDRKELTGEDTINWSPLIAEVGSLDSAQFHSLLRELTDRNLIANRGSAKISPYRNGGELSTSRYDLTLDGWQSYEKEKRGGFSGRYGFLALKFGDGVLDPFVNDVLKPVVKSRLGYEVRDMRDVGRAGLIDNIMREQIRDSAFVIVDLTHDNAGAYWEGGYAEGLAKPVIYICEQSKFEAAKSHFDTNHSTTVPWSPQKPEEFKKELIATLRRSLGLFSP